MPDPADPDAPRRPADELRRIARYQRWVLAVLLVQVTLWLAFLLFTAIRGDHLDDWLRLPTILTFVLGGVGGIFTLLLYWTLRGPFAAAVMGLGCVPPCMGVLVLLVANSTATAALKTNGVRVGLFGATDADIPDDHAPYEDGDAGW